VDGDVYFAVERISDYGRLSGRKLGDNRAGERVAVDSRKRNPADFALWKVSPYALSIQLFSNITELEELDFLRCRFIPCKVA